MKRHHPRPTGRLWALASTGCVLLPVLLAMLLPAAPAAAATSAGGSGWQLPLAGSPPLLRPFDPPAHKWSAGHRGVDLAAAPGTDVLAAGPGVVAFAGPVAGRGAVTVRHGALRTTYVPVRASVEVGTEVAAGDVIGTVEVGDHCGSRSCLHWGLLRGEQYLDPMVLLRPGRAHLVPVWGIPWGAPASASAEPARLAARRRPPGRGGDQNETHQRGVPSSPPPRDRPATAPPANLNLAAAAGAVGATGGLGLLAAALRRRRRKSGTGRGGEVY
ncbi:MAG: murein hydrolase activator EnvC family protein [Streptosporangiales bacterium]